jgi:hypothetical protein
VGRNLLQLQPGSRDPLVECATFTLAGSIQLFLELLLRCVAMLHPDKVGVVVFSDDLQRFVV